MKTRIAFGLIILFAATCFAQPTPPATGTLVVNTTTGAIVAPVSAATFGTTNGFGGGGSTVSSAAGTANQVLVNGGTTAQSGAVTFSLPTTLSGINSVTSVAGQNLVLALGTGGTALTLANSTLAATFAGNLIVSGTGTSSFAGNVNVAYAGDTGAVSFGSSSPAFSSPTTTGAYIYNSGTGHTVLHMSNASLGALGTQGFEIFQLNNGAISITNLQNSTLTLGTNNANVITLNGTATTLAGNLTVNASDASGLTLNFPYAVTGTNGPSVNFKSWTNSAVLIDSGRIQSIISDGSASYASFLAFKVASAGALSTEATLNGSGLSVTHNLTVNGTGTSSFAGKISGAASTTSAASLNLPHGSAPTSPVDGDVWTTTAGMYARINGTTVGPFGTGGTGAVPAGGTTGQVLAKNSNTDYDLIWSTLSASSVGLGSVTNDAQTKAAIMPNTAPSAGQLPVGNAGGTAYAPVTISGDATLASTGSLTLANTAVSAGTYYNVTAMTVDAKGRVTAISTGPRVTSVSYAATVTPNADTTDVLVIAALTGNLTLGNPTGTLRDGQRLLVRLAQDATGSRSLTLDTSYVYTDDITAAMIPTTASKKWDMLFIYDSTAAKWVASAINRGTP